MKSGLILLRRLFTPLGKLMEEERENDIGALKLTELDPTKRVGILTQRFSVKAERILAYRCFLENFEFLLPESLQLTKKVTPGPVGVGTRYTAIPNLLTKPVVNVEITSMEEGKGLVYGYLEGSPFAGRNAIAFEDGNLGTQIEVTLRYQLKDVANWVGWFILGGKRFHKRLVVEGVRGLKTLLGGKK